MSENLVPLKIARLLSLFLAFAFAVIAGSVGLNALVKSNQEKSATEKILPANTTLVVNDNDVFKSGTVITAVSALIALLCLVYILILLLSRNYENRYTRLSNRLLPFEWMSLAFCAAFLFATQIPYTHFFATRSAQVSAFFGTFEIPSSVVQAVQASLGVTTVYKSISYLRLVAILPWFTFLFTSVAAGVSFVASRRRFPRNHEKRESEVTPDVPKSLN
ncbi:hypothetical protein BDP27DRAFT_1295798 [Rhodocollybia butyracea]|uniref:Uncharacterized protein n=1 Tax=Rhodocollybia butyracea TaxID=206335 RepID=A0A9P5PSZ6_9AGAR|nr:hypothetical protein BDP27DRAFT_1295798 [Rhodocollybia butyracea]